MKTSIKVLLVALCAVALVATSIIGTLAYLTSQDSVTNTFTVGNVKITLDESKVTEYGVLDGNTRVKANEYKLIPGSTYTKDPTIHVDQNSEDSWLFVKIENGLADIEGGTTIAAQLMNNGWKQIDSANNIYAHNAKATAGTDVAIFGSFTIKGETTSEDLEALKAAKIVVTAYAIQAANFDTAEAAWTAVGAQFNTTNG